MTVIRERFVPLMDGCRLMADGHLMPLLSQLFDNAPAVLLEFADKAQSNSAQQRFFEAMRGIAQHRPAMENLFLQELQRQFREFPEPPRAGRDREDSQDGDMLDLALVEQDDLDERLALQNTVAKAQVAYAEELYGLRKRLALVAGGRKIEEEEIPAGPQQLAAGFRAAAQGLPVEPKAKLVVFILFDRFVMSRLADLYKEYNRRLIDEGLLPHLKYEVAGGGRRAGSSGARNADQADRSDTQAPATEANETQAHSVAEQTFAAICELLAGHHRGSGKHRREVGGEVVAPPMVVSAIDRLEAEAPASSRGIPQPKELISSIQIDEDLIRRIKATLIDQRERLFVAVNRDRMGEIDAEIIDLVGLIFEYMLNDDSVPDAVKALLSHLHTPFLKLAIVDKTFFTQESHPARQLFNTMVDAGARYVVETDLKRGIFPHLQTVVHRVRTEFDGGLALFEVLLAELRSRLDQMRNVADVTERRTREAAMGQEKLEAARRRASEVLAAAVHGRAVPPAILDLLRQSFTDKLAFILLRDREGERGALWQTGLRLLGDIAISTSPPATEAALGDLRRRLPDLQARIRTDLEALARFGGDDPARLYQQITGSQQAALSAVPGGRIGLRAAPETGKHAATATQQDPADSSPLSPEEDRVARSLEKIDFGTWFEFVPGDNKPRRRLKLAWYTPVASRYMFVDTMGVQAAVLSRRDLAREMAAGRICVSTPERRPFLDRALDAVRNLLGGRDRVAAASAA